MQQGFQSNPLNFVPHIQSNFNPSQEPYQEPGYQQMQSAQPPLVFQEKPSPMKFTSSGGPKLIQFDPSLQARQQSRKVPPRPKIMKNPPRNVERQKVQQKEVKKVDTKVSESGWNSNTVTAGVFDVDLAKKGPVALQHAIKKAVGNNRQQGKAYKSEMRPNQQKGHQGVKLSKKFYEMADNLDIKFVADQEQVIAQLQKQLEIEKESRKKLDNEFKRQLHDIEGYQKLNTEMKRTKSELEQAKKILAQKKNPPRQAQSAPRQVQKPQQGPKLLSKPPGLYVKPQHKQQIEQSLAPNSEPKIQQSVATEKEVNRFIQFPNTNSDQYVQNLLQLKENLVKNPQLIRDASERSVMQDEDGGNIIELPTREKPELFEIMGQKKQQKDKPINYKGLIEYQEFDQKSRQHQLKAMAGLNEEQPLFKPMPQQPRQKEQPMKKLQETKDFVEDLREKLDPLLSHVTEAVYKLDFSRRYGNGNMLGMVSKVSAKYISYYADDLTSLLLDDILIDTVQELQNIEERQAQYLQNEFVVQAQYNFDKLAEEFIQLEPKFSKYLEQAEIDAEMTKYYVDLPCDDQIIIETPNVNWQIYIEDYYLKEYREYARDMQIFQKKFAGFEYGNLWDVYAALGDEFLSNVFIEVINEIEEAMNDFTTHIVTSEFS